MIALKDLQNLLAHVGARLGFFEDPPTVSFCVEPGNYGGVSYEGVVFTPSTPAAGLTRIDAVIANPATGDLELVPGAVGAGAPSLDAFPGAGVVAHVSVLGRDNGKVLIERSHITDFRELVQPVTSGSIRPLFEGRVTLGANMPIVGSTSLLGSQALTLPGLEDLANAYPWPTVFKVITSKYSIKAASHQTVAWLELEAAYFIEDLSLEISPYDTVLRSGADGAKSGFWWKRAKGITLDGQSRLLPRVQIGVVAQGELEAGKRFHDPRTLAARANGFVHFRAWGRA